jgi:hypothetical protein
LFAGGVKKLLFETRVVEDDDRCVWILDAKWNSAASHGN